MTHVYVPAVGLDAWRARLADPEAHWRDGYSAKLTAEAWQAGQFPPSVRAALDTADESLRDIKPLLVFPEHQVALPPAGARPSQADVWVLAAGAAGLVSVAVEGKKAESFGPTLQEWLQNASDGKRERLAFLCSLLGLPATLPPMLRYQFLHRAVCALLEAKRFHASIAVSLVHSFSDLNAGSEDYRAFVALFGAVANPGEFVLLSQIDGVSLYAAWVYETSA